MAKESLSEGSLGEEEETPGPFSGIGKAGSSFHSTEGPPVTGAGGMKVDFQHYGGTAMSCGSSKTMASTATTMDGVAQNDVSSCKA